MIILGLKRGSVKLVPHQKGWKALFEKEKTLLRNELGQLALDIQHIGSTAIPTISAKPILDISIGIKSLKEGHAVIKKMKRLGYEHIPRSRKHYEYFFVKGPESKRTHHIHILRHKGMIWNQNIRFRDYLLKNKSWAKKYEQLKQRLASGLKHDRSSYTKAKRSFVDLVVQRSTHFH